MNSILQFITVLFIFLFVLVITYLTTRWAGGFQKTQYQGKNIELIDAGRLTQHQYIQIVRIGERYMVLGISKDQIAMLGEVSKEELIFDDKDKLQSSETFQKILEQAKKIVPRR